MKNFHVLQVSPMIGDVAKNPPRVRIKSQRMQQSVLIPWNNEPGEIISCTEVAERWLKSKGFQVVGKGEGNSEYDYIITSTFEPLKPFK